MNNETTTPDYVLQGRAVAGLIDQWAEIDNLGDLLDNALVVIEDYLDLIREATDIEPSDRAKAALRKLHENHLVELPIKRFTVDYIIGTTYTVQIDAFDEDDALRIFEEKYENHDGEVPSADEIEVTHEVRSVEPNAFQ